MNMYMDDHPTPDEDRRAEDRQEERADKRADREAFPKYELPGDREEAMYWGAHR